ncbi:MAG TPA: DUF5615 family PIN-like protein [Streptosporangiaceae bacterium]|nr:DUF5615 family PIN-like protein [Streptosporangiaceae bacterium]
MRFLVDENLSPRVGELLAKAGHDAAQVRDLQAASAPDSAVMTLAADDAWVILSADTDFGALLAEARATSPSVILVREVMGLRPADLVSLVLAQLDVLAPHLEAGAIAAVTTTGIRVRTIPLR